MKPKIKPALGPAPGKKRTKMMPAKTLRIKAEGGATIPRVFTVRDLNRNTKTLLAAVRHHGQVLIKGRNGETFKIEPTKSPAFDVKADRPDFVERMRLHRLRMRELGVKGPETSDGVDRLNRIIAGEA